MRPSLRFLAIALVGWGGFRFATLGSLPGAELLRLAPAAPAPAAMAAADFAAITPIAPAPALPPPVQSAAMPLAIGPVQPLVIPVYYSYRAAPTPAPPRSLPAVWPLPEPSRQFYAPAPQQELWPLVRASVPTWIAAPPAAPVHSPTPAIAARQLDRIQLTMWAMIRSRQVLGGPTSLASGGTLGASQAGARLLYNFTPDVAAVVRSSSEVNRRGGELAAGIRARPLRSIPLWITAERRQRLGRYGGGRNAFALFAETGLYDRPLAWGFTLDGYAQGGVVGIDSRDLFADGGAALSRPLFREFSGGFGVWGGVQPGLYRVDAGPRLTMKVRRNVKVHVDWRQRLAGNAQPGSGPVLTLAGDF